MSKSLNQKIVRPGSLGNYSYYHSSRSNREPEKTRSGFSIKKILLIVVLFGAVIFGYQHSKLDPVVSTQPAKQASVQKAPAKKTEAVAAVPKEVNECAANTEPKFIIVSVKQRKMWACEADKMVHSSAVITGMEMHASTETPEGTYTVYGKQKDTVLTGQDEAGSWKRPVAYWMPFLDNQHGTYGFHDADWRDPSEFGNIDPFSSDKASHGCVELPSDTQKWLYEWAPVGTNLNIKA